MQKTHKWVSETGAICGILAVQSKTTLQFSEYSHWNFWLNHWNRVHKITTIKGVLCTFESAFLINHAGVVIQAYSSPSVDQFSDNSIPFKRKRKSNEFHFRSVDFDFTPLLLLPAPIFFTLHLPKGLGAWKRMWVVVGKKGKKHSMPESD